MRVISRNVFGITKHAPVLRSKLAKDERRERERDKSEMSRRWPTCAKRARDEKGRELSPVDKCLRSVLRWTFAEILSPVLSPFYRPRLLRFDWTPRLCRANLKNNARFVEGASVKATKNFFSYEDMFLRIFLWMFLVSGRGRYTYVFAKKYCFSSNKKIR